MLEPARIGDTDTLLNVSLHTLFRCGKRKTQNLQYCIFLQVDGEFVGGCDIVMQMFKDGEFTKLVKDKKLAENTK